MASFLNLPAEIRNMIYRYCLVQNQTLIPYKEHYPLSKADLAFRKDLPTVALLQVCKKIETEAAAVLYGQNVWRITSKSCPGVISSAGKTRSSIWERRASMFRNVVIVFDQQDVDRDELYKRTLELHKSYSDFEVNGHNLLQNLTGFRRSSQMHTQGDLIMAQSWDRRFYLAYGMGYLTLITFDLSRLFCPMGCCRKETILSMFDDFLYAFDDIWAAINTDLKYRVKGIRVEELDEVLRDLDLPKILAERFTMIQSDSHSLS